MGTVIKISEATSIAIHSLVYLANAGENLNVKQIAEFVGASESHLSKVMQTLARQGIVNSERGPKGGFTIARKLSAIKLIDIYELFDGKIDVSCCPFEKKECMFSGCVFNGVTARLSAEFKKYLEDSSLEDFVKKEGCK